MAALDNHHRKSRWGKKFYDSNSGRPFVPRRFEIFPNVRLSLKNVSVRVDYRKLDVNRVGLE